MPKDKTKVRDNWKTQPRSKGGKFLPKDVHVEDMPLIDDRLFYSPLATFTDYLTPPITFKPTQRRSKGRWRVILGYVGYVVLCFAAGALGAILGVSLT